MQRWEYKTLVIELEQHFWTGSKFPHDAIGKNLDELGQQGWELVSAETNSSYQGQSSQLLCILKRAIQGG